MDDVYKASKSNALPRWLDSFNNNNKTILINLLSNLKSSDNKGPFEFDLSYRSGDYELIGMPTDDGIPVLSINRDSNYWSFIPNLDVLKLIQQYMGGDNSTVAQQIMKIEVRPLTEFISKRPEEASLKIVESWRIMSVFEKYSVGNPSGSITVTPGETKEVIFRTKQNIKDTDSMTKSIFESKSWQTIDKFERNLKKQIRNEKGSSEDINWSTSNTYQNIFGNTVNNESTKESLSAKKIRDIIKDTNRTTTETLNSKRDVTIGYTTETIDEKEKEVTKTNTITNKNTGLVITYIYHYLNAVYRVHIDIFDLNLVYFNGKSTDAPIVLNLEAGAKQALAKVVNADTLEDSTSRVVKSFRELYGELSALNFDNNDVSVTVADANDVNNDTSTRSKLLGGRRSTGGLPLNIGSNTEIIQTTNLHAIPSVSEFTGVEPNSQEPNQDL